MLETLEEISQALLLIAFTLGLFILVEHIQDYREHIQDYHEGVVCEPLKEEKNGN